MTRRLVVALLNPVRWSPPGVPRQQWRAALAEDVVDLLARLAEADAAVAAVPGDVALAKEIAWPGMAVYEVPTATVLPVLHRATEEGYDQAAVLAADAPDVPGMVLGKLLRPVAERAKPVAVAPAGRGQGAVAVAAALPVPPWLPDLDLDAATPMNLRRGAPQPSLVESTPEWRRLCGPEDLATLDMGLEGWDNTRALLGG